jgi:hypothetical protein
MKIVTHRIQVTKPPVNFEFVQPQHNMIKCNTIHRHHHQFLRIVTSPTRQVVCRYQYDILACDLKLNWELPFFFIFTVQLGFSLSVEEDFSDMIDIIASWTSNYINTVCEMNYRLCADIFLISEAVLVSCSETA